MKSSVDRRQKLSYEEFAREYMYPCKPVIIQGVLDHWPAMKLWTPEFFKSRFAAMKLNIKAKEYGQEGYDANADQLTMGELIDRVLVSTKENPAPYLRNVNLKEVFPSIADHVLPMPEYMQPNWVGEEYTVDRITRVLKAAANVELYIGGKGGNFPVLHYDGAGTHAVLMQIYGRKQYIVFHPDEERYLYRMQHKINLSPIDVDNPDLEKYPLYAKAKKIVFELEPGELLFVPARWWHTAKILTPSITVSVNVLNQSNWGELMRFVSGRDQSKLISAAAWAYLSLAGAKRSWRDRAWRKRVYA